MATNNAKTPGLHGKQIRSEQNMKATFGPLLNWIQGTQIGPPERREKNSRIKARILDTSSSIDAPNFCALSTRDLRQIFELMDGEYFSGLITAACRELGHQLEFRLSKRMSSTGGMTTLHPKAPGSSRIRFEIAVATNPLFQTFQSMAQARVGGLRCSDRLEALQRILEHELIHLVEMILWNDSNCRANRFRELVFRFFGHVESNHQLLTAADVARREQGIRVGDRVQFYLGDQLVVGFVNRITRRATVLVPDSQGYPYSDGRRYRKYYVPIPLLRLAIQ